jgi:hypothetical protein
MKTGDIILGILAITLFLIYRYRTKMSGLISSANSPAGIGPQATPWLGLSKAVSVLAVLFLTYLILEIDVRYRKWPVWEKQPEVLWATYLGVWFVVLMWIIFRLKNFSPERTMLRISVVIVALVITAFVRIAWQSSDNQKNQKSSYQVLNIAPTDPVAVNGSDPNQSSSPDVSSQTSLPDNSENSLNDRETRSGKKSFKEQIEPYLWLDTVIAPPNGTWATRFCKAGYAFERVSASGDFYYGTDGIDPILVKKEAPGEEPYLDLSKTKRFFVMSQDDIPDTIVYGYYYYSELGQKHGIK